MGIKENVKFERVCQMGSKWKKSDKKRSRSIVAEFACHKLKERVKFAAKKLSTTNIGVPEQFSLGLKAKCKELGQ